MASNWERGLFDEWKAFSRNMNLYFFSCPVFSDQRSKNKVVLYAQGWIEGWPNLKEKWRLSMARIFYKHKWCSKRKPNNRNYRCTSISASFNIDSKITNRSKSNMVSPFNCWLLNSKKFHGLQFGRGKKKRLYSFKSVNIRSLEET